MDLSAFFPTVEIGRDPAKIRDWAQAAEDLGYRDIEVADHVFGVTARDGWKPRYDASAAFHETLTTLAFLAAVTKKIRLSSGVLILPQRQTGVVAKQAAEVDILSAGRLRLGVGVGANFPEYEALGVDFKTRGARQAEQVQVLRKLWTEDSVTFSGRFHDMREVSLVPKPVQQPIPIWFGGSSDATIDRAARLGDGWMPILAPSDGAAAKKVALLRDRLQAYGRDPAAFGLEAWLPASEPDPERWAAAATAWRRLGAGMVMLWPAYRIGTFDDQVATLRRFKEVVAA